MVTEFSIPGRSLLHRLDPRAKVVSLVILLPAFFLPSNPWLPAAYAAGLSLVILFCLGARELARCLAAVAPLLLIILALTPVFRRGGQVVWSPFGVPLLTTEGLRESLRIVGRFAGLTLGFYAVFRTLDMDDLVLSLRWYGLPFRAALALIVALRFIPTLFTLYRNVQDAHSLRRAGERPTGFFRRIMPQLTSVVVQAVRMIPALAMALETRGFGRASRRTDWRRLPSGRASVLSFAAIGLLAAAVYAPFAL